MSFVDLVLVVRLGVGTDERELAEATGQLRRELLRHEVEEVRPAALAAETTEGAKSGALQAIGSLVVTLAPLAFSAVLSALQTWAERDAARSVDIRLGEESFTGSGLTRKQQDELVAGFLERTRLVQATEPGDGEA